MSNQSSIRHAIFVLVSLTALAAPLAMAADTAQEQCYGIAKAGMNDCKTNTASCAGSSTKDSQPDAFLLVPKGLCQKITGGSLTPKRSP